MVQDALSHAQAAGGDLQELVVGEVLQALLQGQDAGSFTFTCDRLQK